MPELPEVETVRRGLAPVMEGRVIARAEARRPDLRWPLPDRFTARLTGARVERLGRRSKYLTADLSTGETLLIHLGMSGRLLISRPGDSVAALIGEFRHAKGSDMRHDHVVLDMEGGLRVTFNDARRFGSMDLVATPGVGTHRLIADLGPEPLGSGFDGDWLAAALAGRRTPIKAALLDQRTVAGLGNIYACESLWRSGISPLRPAGSLSAARVARLVGAIREVLGEAIEAGGSSLRDYRHADGELGRFQTSFAVYGREGGSCLRPRCRGRVRRAVQAGRSSFHCPACQR